jgi:hypothetical protein
MESVCGRHVVSDARPLFDLEALRFFIPCTALLIGGSLSAQSVMVSVRDSATSAPLPGVVVTVVDARDSVLARGLTGSAGVVRLYTAPTASAIRVTRIGFRYQVRRFASADMPGALSFAMSPQPMLLDPVVSIRKASCSQRPDRQAAYSLLSHARSGLLAAIVAQNAGSDIIALRYRRWMDGISDSIAAQEVRRDSAEVLTSFSSSLTAADFVSVGFVTAGPNGPVYHAPDGAVLLDDAMSAGYCFHIASAVRHRPNEVGLAFSRPDRKDKRVDVNGVLWIDTVARALRDIEYRYVGLDYRLNSVRPGGTVHFTEVRPGVVMVDRWFLRVPAADTLPPPAGTDFRTAVRAAELGGELARASWSDGEEWIARLGYLVVRVVNPDSTPAVGRLIALENTDYRARVDTLGFARFRELLPGPYRISVADPRADRLGFTIPTEIKAQIARDSTTLARAEAATLEGYVAARCAKEKHWWASDTARLLLRIVPQRPSTSVAGIHVTFTDESTGRQLARDSFVTASDGVVALCRNIHAGMVLTARATRTGDSPVTVPVTLGPALTIVPLRWP